MGTLFLGRDQPVRVVFDTGSENLVVSSNYCFDYAGGNKDLGK